MADEYGVTPEGFIRKDLQTIRNEILSSMDEEFGVVVDRRPDSVVGILAGILSYALSDLWAAAEATYNAMYPFAAEGISLDGSTSFAGVKRIAGEKTILTAILYGKNGTILPSSAQIRSSADQSITFSSRLVTMISVNDIVYAELKVKSIDLEEKYYLILNGKTITYTMKEGDNEVIILNELAEQIEEDFITEINNGKLIIRKIDIQTSVSLLISNALLAEKIGTPTQFECDSFGSIDPGIGRMTEMVTRIVGWEAVDNPINSIVGRNTETTTELRQRYNNSVYVLGMTMLESIRANLNENVPGVLVAEVFENYTDDIDIEGRPPHSFECVVQGGGQNDIAKMIWRQKAPGIDTHGSLVVEIIDSQGATQVVKFNRPEEIKIWLKVQIGKNTEEELPGDTLTTTRNIILQEGNKIKIGQDVVLQKLFGPIYRATIGIGYLIITAAYGEERPEIESYSANNIEISVRQLAAFSMDRIEVNLVEEN